MKCSSCAVAAAMVLFTATLAAGESGFRRTAYKHSPVPYLRGMSSGCNSCFAGEIRYESACDRGCSAGCEARCDSGCDSGCGVAGCGCGGRMSPLLPSLMDGLDCLVQRLYYKPCNTPYPRPRCGPGNCMDIWFGYNSGCGCNSYEMDSWPSEPSHVGPSNSGTPSSVPMRSTPKRSPPTPMPTDPFKDDELQAPPAVPADLGLKRNSRKLQPVQHRRPKYSQGPTLVAPVRVAEVIETPRVVEPVAATQVAEVEAPPVAEPVAVSKPRPARSLQQVKHETPVTRVIPKNPLRDE